MSRERQTRDFLSEPLPDLDTAETSHFAGHLYVEWSRYREEELAAYRAPNENCVLVAVPFLGCFQTDNIHEIIQRLNHRGISSVEGGDLFPGNGLVRGKGLQDAGCQWGVNLFIKLQENQADLITVRE